MSARLATKNGAAVDAEAADRPPVCVPWELDGPHFAPGAKASPWATAAVALLLLIVAAGLAGYFLNR